MSTLQNRNFGNLAPDSSPASSQSPRTPANPASIHSFSNFATLQGARGTSGTAWNHNDRSRSPGFRNSGEAERRLEEDASQEPTDQRRTPLGAGESLVFDKLATKAGLDEANQMYALANCEASGFFASSRAHGVYRHIVTSVCHTKIKFEVKKMSNQLLKMADHVIGILDKVEAALARVNAISTNVEGLSDKVELNNEHIETLTKLIQSSPNVLNGNAPHVPNAQNPPSAVAWSVSTELRGAIITAAHRFIVKESLESYTALETPQRDWLPHSLFNSIKTAVRQGGAVTQFLPPQVNGISDVPATRIYNSEIKNVCKHVRERLHLLLLTGVYDPKNPVVHGAVPTLKGLVHRIFIKLGQTGDHSDIESVWANTSELARCRFAYLRREAVCIFQVGQGSSSIWSAVDHQLNDLRCRGHDYTASFYNIVYDDDISAFDGQNLFQDVAENVSFRLPYEHDVLAGIGGAQEDVMNE
ncbi:uncharacterized protein MELLADRAFT_61155 [Melampsora larici-populina 98AG31]|uniref:Uncharacterized protein n=1 Tax=Melampsora larici-populina (strain 98AG31 / pathotype 3-4-7) TaxID=747676 RepID=F4RDT6_MELLP|nr:uncharacterized protein MELLADRAFT_61155 [Melampsora larici-populina 98AG31]EGG09458.1 hypothetical protein MELLADRAFT_61155 [Melampsora larici-populina 98AG31]